MRPIKFRAWERPDNHRFVKDNSGFLGAMHYGDDVLFYLHKWITNPDYEILQFTGLYAKGDKPIYEGDILKYKSSKTELSEVYYSASGFKITQQSNKTTRSLEYHLQKYNVEIIGNIYENPELLTN